MAYTAINKSTDFFNTKLWTGNSTTDRAITGVGHQPDMLWIKGRNEGTDHEVQDAVRGSDKYIRPNLNGNEGTEEEGVKSFDSDGYTLGNANYWNWTSKTFVGWSWKAGTTTGLAKERINRHLLRFWQLINVLNKKEEISTNLLESFEKEDRLFPIIEYRDWSRKKD